MPAYEEAEFKIETSAGPHEIPPRQMVEILTRIVEIEGPVHEDELARRVARLAGSARTGSRIVEAVQRGLKLAKSSKVIVSDGAFLLAQGAEIKVRSRAQASPSLRKGEMLPPQEIAAAIGLAKAENGLMSEDELIMEVTHLFGFERTGPDLREAISAVASQL